MRLLAYCSRHLGKGVGVVAVEAEYEGWNFNSGNYLFTTDTK